MMRVKNILGGVVFLLASGGIANAIPAVVETDLNVRIGPGTGYATIDVLPGGATVDVIACYSGWCEVSWEGLDGFASRSYLDIVGTATVFTPPSSVAVIPGVIVYERSYWNRPVWGSAGRFIRRELRRDARQDRREFRQERRQDSRQDARQERRQDARQDARRDRRQDARQDRRQDARKNVRQERRQDVRQNTRQERRQDARQPRQNAGQNARAEQRQENRQNRQNRRERER